MKASCSVELLRLHPLALKGYREPLSYFPCMERGGKEREGRKQGRQKEAHRNYWNCFCRCWKVGKFLPTTRKRMGTYAHDVTGLVIEGADIFLFLFFTLDSVTYKS